MVVLTGSGWRVTGVSWTTTGAGSVCCSTCCSRSAVDDEGVSKGVKSHWGVDRNVGVAMVELDRADLAWMLRRACATPLLFARLLHSLHAWFFQVKPSVGLVQREHSLIIMSRGTARPLCLDAKCARSAWNRLVGAKEQPGTVHRYGVFEWVGYGWCLEWDDGGWLRDMVELYVDIADWVEVRKVECVVEKNVSGSKLCQ